MGASNSSKIQQSIQQSIANDVKQWGDIEQNTVCNIKSVEILAKRCKIDIQNVCLQEAEIVSEQIFELVATASAQSLVDQSNAMLAFLTSNNSNVKQSIKQRLETEISNSCEVIGSTTAVISDIRIVAQNCGRSGITIRNLGESKARCVMNQSTNIITDADLIAETGQSNSLFGTGLNSSGSCQSSTEENLILWVIMIVVVVFIMFIFILMFGFLQRRRRKNMQ